jgi:hypothetical protein
MYSLSDFTDISNKGFDVILPNATVKLINELSKLVGSPNYIKTPVFTKRESSGEVDKKRRRQRNKPSDGSTDGWSPSSTSEGFKRVSPESNIGANIVFNPTGPLIKKGGANATPIQLVRPLLNKFGGSNTNKTVKTELFAVLNDIFESDITQEEMTILMNQIIEIVSGNIFYSDIYARLFSEMIDLYPTFTDTLETLFSKYLESYTRIQLVDPKKDYDLFCNMNKMNDRRKALTTFYVNLYKLDKLTQCSMLSTIKSLNEMIRDNLYNIESTQLVVELIENIFIFMNPSSRLYIASRDVIIHPTTDIEDGEVSISICDYIIKLSEASPKLYPGMNTKSLFKLKDLVDNYAK